MSRRVGLDRDGAYALFYAICKLVQCSIYFARVQAIEVLRGLRNVYFRWEYFACKCANIESGGNPPVSRGRGEGWKAWREG